MEFRDLFVLVDLWVNRKLFNFNYLMIFNYLIGRRLGDFNYYSVLLWVMDFFGLDIGLRDFIVFKFRLNKGDY